MSSEPESRKLSDLRVVDLRSELEKRGLDRSGNKSSLLERLQKALQDDGLDPNTYQFETDKKPAKRLSVSSSQPENESLQKDTALDMTGEDCDELLCDTTSTILAEVEEADKNDNLEKDAALEVKDQQLLDSTKKSEENDRDSRSEESKKEDTKIIESKELEIKEESQPAESESPIRLTLEEEEAFQDEEVEPVLEDNKPAGESEKADQSDKKNTSTKNQEHAAKDLPVNSQKTQEMKKQDGNATSGGASASKAAKFKKSHSQNRNLWITNISQTTRATELKQALSSYGKVIGAKVVINAKYPGACCYGYVTMDTVQDADNCIVKLNNTELNGQIIRIEKVRPDHMTSAKLNPKLRPENRDDKSKSRSLPYKSSQTSKPPETKEDDKKDIVMKDGEKIEKKDDKRDDKKDGRSDGHKSDSSTGRRRDFKRRSRSHDKIRERDHHRSDSKGNRPRLPDKDVLTFDKIKEERERQRLRERERVVREESRRRREEIARQREIERLQRSEAARLDREREKLRMEREKLERDRAEIIRLERERQKLEREKLEMEKMELQRAKIRLQEEDRRAVKRPAPYRREGSYEDRKRLTGERRYEESPPPPRFDPTSVKARDPTPPVKKFGGSTAKDYKSRVGYDKRESYPSKRDREYEAERSHPQSSISRGPPTSITKYEGSAVFNISRERDMRDGRPRDNASAVSNSRIPKDSRYNERDRERSPHYRQVRDERDRRAIPDHKGDVRSSRDHRYAEASKDGQRFDRNSGGNNWNHPNASNKVFNAGGSGAPPKSWSKDWRPTDSNNPSERWNSGNVSRGTSSLSTTAFSGGNSNLNLGPSCPPPPAINNYTGDRFEYKSMSNIRKY